MPLMGRVAPETLEDRNLVRVYIAVKLAEARQVEALLTRSELEFTVIVEPAGRTLFGSARNGAVFCVAEEHSTRCCEVLTRAGFAVGLVPPGKPG